MKLDQKGNLWG